MEKSKKSLILKQGGVSRIVSQTNASQRLLKLVSRRNEPGPERREPGRGNGGNQGIVAVCAEIVCRWDKRIRIM